jgi:hypothetical protein
MPQDDETSVLRIRFYNRHSCDDSLHFTLLFIGNSVWNLGISRTKRPTRQEFFQVVESPARQPHPTEDRLGVYGSFR